MLDGQFYPFQPIQFMDGLLSPIIGLGVSSPSFSFVASGSGITSTVTIPGTPTSGDICIIWSWFRNTLASGGLPSGFTNGVASGAPAVNEGGGRISIKKLDGTETTVTIEQGSNATAWIAATFHPSSPITSFTVNDPASEATNNDPAAQTINASGATTPVLALAQLRLGTQSFDTMNTIANGSDASHVAGYQIFNPGSTPSNITIDTTDGGNQMLVQSLYLTFT